MPKDEFDFEDPLELNRVALLSTEDTIGPMTECFIEEFIRLGYNHKQILALFRNPYYLGMHLALKNRGEAFVRTAISEAFARRGTVVSWPANTDVEPPAPCEQKPTNVQPSAAVGPTDPLGNPVPQLDL
jgi:hypothetical protein